MAAAGDDAVSGQAVLYMVLLAVQFGTQPLLNASFLPRGIIRTTPVLVGELVKFCVGAIMLFLVERKGRLALRNWTLTDSLSKAGIPAFIYAFQNLLIMRGFLYLDGLTINLINQTKTIFTAICVYLLLGRRQSRMQCVALLMLFSASVLLALDRGASTGPAGAAKAPADYEAWLFGGVVPVFLASILSGLASALSQRSLQGQERNSFLFSMELSVYSSLTLLVRTALGSEDGARIGQEGFFSNWEMTTLIPITTNAVGGIIVGLVMKHAGGVRKGFSILAGILLTGYLDVVVAENPLTWPKLVSLPIVLLASYLHIIFPYKAPREEIKAKKE